MYALPSSIPYVDLLPGPFILLILIPLLPITLFSLGARPPGPSSLPILTDELWRTTVLLGMAISVALAVGMYPDSLSDVAKWVKDGSMSVSVSSMKVGDMGMGWFGWGQKRVMTPAMARRIAQSRKPSFERVAANHIRALRYYHPRLYDASQPKLSSVVGLGLGIAIVTIVVLGKVLKAVYKSDRSTSSTSRGSGSGAGREKSSGPSEWVQKEYAARKKEKPEETKSRFKKDEEALSNRYKEKKKSLKGKEEEYEKYISRKSEVRRKDVEQLKKMLKAKKIEPVGLDKDPGWMVKPKSKDKDKDKEKGKEKDVSKKAKEGVKETKTKTKTKEDDSSKLTMGDKIRVALLGKTMAQSMKKEDMEVKSDPKSAARSAAAASGAPPAIQAMPERGRGWEVADGPTANAALATSAGNAEALARGMGK